MTRKKERSIVWLFLGFTALSALGFFTRTFAPQTFALVVAFLFILSFGLFSFVYFATVNLRSSLLLSAGVAVWLFLRYAGLREPIFLILLLASVLSVEIYFRKR